MDHPAEKSAYWMIAAVLLFAAGAWLKIDAPLTYWDSTLLEWGQSPVSEPPAATSPFYLVLVRGLAGLGALSVPVLRGINVCGVLLSALAAYRLAGLLWRRSEIAVLSFVFYLLHPAVVQGTQSLDMADASFFPAAFTLWMCEFVSDRTVGRTRFMRLGLWAALAIGWKTTSALGLLSFPVLALVDWRADRSTRPQRLRDLMATLAGFALFAAAWWSLQRWESWSASSTSAVDAVASRAVDGALLRLAFHSVLGLAWWGPFLAMLTVLGAVQLLRSHEVRRRALVGGAALYAIGYLVVGGINHGFPRYHVAILPLLCTFAAGPIKGLNWKGKSLAVVVLLTVFFSFVPHDPVYDLNVTFREALLQGTLRARAFREALIWIAWVGLPLLVGIVAWKRQRAWFLALCSLAGSLAIGWVQARAPYVTAYGYGAEGGSRVIEWVAANTAAAPVLCPPNLSAGFKQRGFPGSSHHSWGTRQRILDYIEQNKPAVLVLSLTENTEGQLQWLLRQPPGQFASCRDHYFRIGTYWVCIKPGSRLQASGFSELRIAD